MLHVFKDHLDQRLAQAGPSSAVVQSLEKQSNKLAAIEIPADQDADAQQSLRQVVDESFVSGFRAVMVAGAILAAASALTALILIKTSART
jgi:hypothetical protein